MRANITLTSAVLSALWAGRQSNYPVYSHQQGQCAPAKSNDATQDQNLMQRKRMLQESAADTKEKQKDVWGSDRINDTLNYANSLRESRVKTKNTSLQLKKLHYNFKGLSAQIMRCKTSLSAKQVAGQARREVQRLRNQKNTGQYDDEEIQAAIAHARAMERVAKKKARHLEEEECVKVTGGPCEADLEEKKEYDQAREAAEEEVREADRERMQAEQEARQEMQEAQMEATQEMMERQIEEMAENLREQADQFSEDMMSQMMETLSDSMEDMMEDMGLSELADDLLCVDREMDPADFKMLKIKHRSEEMKAIAKADGEYLKAIFGQLAREMASSSVPSMGTATSSAGAAPSAPAAAPVSVPAEAVPVADLGACVDVSV